MTVDYAIITILEEEYKALAQRFNPIRQRCASGNTYAISRVQSLDGKTYDIAIGRCPEQGSGVAQHLAGDMIQDLSPALLLVVGIAGGVPDNDFTLGDVIVSSRIHDFGINAYKPDNIEWNIRGGIHPHVSEIVAALPMYEKELQGWNTPASIKFPRPEIDRAKFKNFDLIQLTEEEKQDIFDSPLPLPWQKKIFESLKWNFGIPPQRDPAPICSTGSVASSGSLIRNPAIPIEWLQEARSIRAFEMEAAGVFQAAQQVQKQYPVMTIRGISDIPGLRREDGWKHYACHSAAAFTYAFIKAGVAEPLIRESNRPPIPIPIPTDISVDYRHVGKTHGCKVLFTLAEKHSLEYSLEWHGMWGDRFTLLLDEVLIIDTNRQFLGIPELNKSFEVENVKGLFSYLNRKDRFRVTVTVGNTILFDKEDGWNS